MDNVYQLKRSKLTLHQAHFNLKEWSQVLKNSTNKELVDNIFPAYCKFFREQKPFMTHAALAAFRQLGWKYKDLINSKGLGEGNITVIAEDKVGGE